MVFIYYTLHARTYTTVYGSFSVLLFFMLWVYISWIIFLYGQKLCRDLNEIEEKKARNDKGGIPQRPESHGTHGNEKIEPEKP